jgi:hypothetical protein
VPGTVKKASRIVHRRQAGFFVLADGLGRLRDVTQAERFVHLERLAEAALRVVDDLDVVAPRVDDVEPLPVVDAKPPCDGRAGPSRRSRRGGGRRPSRRRLRA